jgi:hypothetical protein
MTLKNFEINEEYLTSQTVEDTITFASVESMSNMTLEQAEMVCSMIGKPLRSIKTIDHPEFTKLREQLEREGYITIQRNWWNGDRALKSFKVNGMIIRKDDTFPCADALKYRR